MKYYAGIGSRKTPPHVLSYFYQLGRYFAQKGYVLRSGAAQGADQAFEKGCDSVGGEKEIYLPWKGFEGSNSPLIVSDLEAYLIAERYHPNWINLSAGAKKLQARNSHQVLGQDLRTPSDFIICWTENGSGAGGTGQAIRIARAYGIPVFDAGQYRDIDQMKEAFKLFYNKLLWKEINNKMKEGRKREQLLERG